MMDRRSYLSRVRAHLERLVAKGAVPGSGVPELLEETERQWAAEVARETAMPTVKLPAVFNPNGVTQ